MILVGQQSQKIKLEETEVEEDKTKLNNTKWF